MRLKISTFILLMTFLGFLSKTYAGLEQVSDIKKSLIAQDVRFSDLRGIGFGIEDFGKHPLNKMAKGLKEKLGVTLILDLRDQSLLGFYMPDVKAVFVSVGKDNIADLLAWDSSEVRSTLLHEVRHAFLTKNFEEKAMPLSAALSGKKPDVLSGLLNPYYEYLNFQEFSTFTLQLRLLYQKNDMTPDRASRILQLATTLFNFSNEATKALKYFSKNLKESEVTYSLKSREGTGARYIELKSPSWDLEFPVDPNFDMNKTPLAAESLQIRITESLNVIEEIKTGVGNLRYLIDQADMISVGKQINELNQIARTSYSTAAVRCESLFL